jgi:hypothetical protein
MISKGDVMRKVAVNMSMSLGGFIAGPNHSVERLHEWSTSWRADVSATVSPVAGRMLTPKFVGG